MSRTLAQNVSLAGVGLAVIGLVLLVVGFPYAWVVTGSAMVLTLSSTVIPNTRARRPRKLPPESAPVDRVAPDYCRCGSTEAAEPVDVEYIVGEPETVAYLCPDQ